MATYFSLCREPRDLRLCRTCQRNAEHHPAAAADPHQAFIEPRTSGERCSTWLAMPATPPNFPRVNTGD